MTRQATRPARRSTLLAALIALLGAALPGAQTAQAQIGVDPGKILKAPGWRETLTKALDTWNAVYGFDVHAVGWTDRGTIADATERKDVVAIITDPALAWFPSIDANDPPSATALQIADDPTIKPEQIDAWRALVDGAVRVGYRKVEIEWSKRGLGTFTSLCIVNGRGIVYDTMLTNTAIGAHEPDRGVQCLNYRMGWAWQSDWKDMTRGHMKAYNNPVCRNGQLISCDYDCNDVSMTLGDAKLNCSSEKVDNCCQLTYSWAWVTSSFKSIKVGADDFTLEVEGSLGSGASGGGKCTACCDRGAGNGCGADFNADGQVDTRDVADFLNAWSAGDASADSNGDGLVDTLDALGFLNGWTRGCD